MKTAIIYNWLHRENPTKRVYREEIIGTHIKIDSSIADATFHINGTIDWLQSLVTKHFLL